MNCLCSYFPKDLSDIILEYAKEDKKQKAKKAIEELEKKIIKHQTILRNLYHEQEKQKAKKAIEELEKKINEHKTILRNLCHEQQIQKFFYLYYTIIESKKSWNHEKLYNKTRECRNMLQWIGYDSVRISPDFECDNCQKLCHMHKILRYFTACCKGCKKKLWGLTD